MAAIPATVPNRTILEPTPMTTQDVASSAASPSAASTSAHSTSEATTIDLRSNPPSENPTPIHTVQFQPPDPSIDTDSANSMRSTIVVQQHAVFVSDGSMPRDGEEPQQGGHHGSSKGFQILGYVCGTGLMLFAAYRLIYLEALEAAEATLQRDGSTGALLVEWRDLESDTVHQAYHNGLDAELTPDGLTTVWYHPTWPDTPVGFGEQRPTAFYYMLVLAVGMVLLVIAFLSAVCGGE